MEGEAAMALPVLSRCLGGLGRRFGAFAVFAALLGSMLQPFSAWALDLTQVQAVTAEVDTAAVEVSYDESSATIEGEPFAIADFARANAGSNRDIGGAYYGYAYYIGKKAHTLMYLTTGDKVVVYIDGDAAQVAQFDPDSADDRALLQALIVAIDAKGAHGNAPLPAEAVWYFTTQQENRLDGVDYIFDREIDGGSYNLIVGADGQDATSADSAFRVRPVAACFADIVASDQTLIMGEPGWWEKLGAFMAALDWSPLWVTLKTTLTAIVFIFVLGLACAYLCLHASMRVRSVLDTVFTVPMVLPPTVCGFLLLLFLGSNTPWGQWFIDVGFPLIFSWPATVIAAVVVAFPLMYRNALGAFENLDPNMVDAARTLGWSEGRIFFRLMLPLSWSSIAAGTVLAFARALGEFGATLFLAGNYLGITQTIPIAIYFQWMNGNNEIAIFWTIILVIFSFFVIMFINLWSRHTTRYRKGAVEE